MINTNGQDDLLCVTPAKSYDAPKYPAYSDTRNNPVLLKKLPSRWQKNAAVIACVGVFGSFALTGCDEFQDGLDRIRQDIAGGPGSGAVVEPYTRETGRDLDITVRAHYGGAGGGPSYVAYLTEQEALSIIRAEAEAAGLRFNDTPPDYSVDIWEDGWGGDDSKIGLDLFDKDKAVAVAYTNMGIHWDVLRWMWNVDIVGETTKAFEKQYKDVTVGVFYDSGETVGWDSYSPENAKEVTEEAKAEAGKNLEEQLRAQVREFIKLLQEKGILEAAGHESDAASDE